MNKKLLSIVVPTKNRYKYLESFVDLLASYEDERMEMVIQDNSDNNQEFLRYLKAKNYNFIIYNYCPEHLSIIENSDRAIKASNGKYVCFMGDDDLVLKDLCSFVELMDKNKVDSAFFRQAKYSWPGVKYKVHDIPNLDIPWFEGKLELKSVKSELKRLLKNGAISMESMPQLYHGVILRKRLEEIYKATGTYFPGPSPDMAVAVALSKFVKKHVVCDVPYTVAGTAPKSGGGMGANHEHKGEIKYAVWLPEDTEEKWEKRLPKIWTGPTIYAESAIKAMRAIGVGEKERFFNYYSNYAYMLVFCPGYTKLVRQQLKGDMLGKIIVFLKVIRFFIKRVIVFFKNIMKFRLGITKDIINRNVSTSFQAGEIINDMISERKIIVEELFEQL